MTGLAPEFDAALRAMEASFHVRLIATFSPDLVCAPADALAEVWLAGHGSDFDQFPVREGDNTVGLLFRRDDHCGRSVREVMTPLSDGLVVAAETPIMTLISSLQRGHARLVIRDDRIDGLVTRSDLLKLPVRLVVFALITHLEKLMADVVTRRWPDDSWRTELTAGRRAKIEQKERDLRAQRMNPPAIELTEFCDKANLCARLVPVSKRQFDHEFKELRRLRDQIAHGAEFLVSSTEATDVAAFVRTFQAARAWIEQLSPLAEACPSQ